MYPFKTALVTGASSGIGEAIVRELASTGVATVVVARRADRLERLANQWVGVEVLVADLFTAAGQQLVVDRIGDPARPIDLVVNNAGFGTNGMFHDLEVDRLANEIELNCVALTRVSSAALTVMVSRQRGWLLNVSSVASFQPAPRLAVYAATKAYVTSLTESLHEEVKASGVHVTALCPGLTKTEFQRVSNTDTYEDQFPRMMWTSPQLVARVGLQAVIDNKIIAVPGRLYKAMVAIVDVLPRGVVRRISARVQRR